MNWDIIEKHMQCPNRHYDKTKLEEHDNSYYWQCNICKRKFHTIKPKLQRSRVRK